MGNNSVIAKLIQTGSSKRKGPSTHEEPSIPSDDDGLPLRTTRHSTEDRLDKVFGVMLLLEDLDLLPETRSTGLLARVGLGLDG